MEIRFDKDCHNCRWYFPIVIEWVRQPWQYYVPAKQLMIHFLCWTVGWTFIKRQVR